MSKRKSETEIIEEAEQKIKKNAYKWNPIPGGGQWNPFVIRNIIRKAAQRILLARVTNPVEK